MWCDNGCTGYMAALDSDQKISNQAKSGMGRAGASNKMRTRRFVRDALALRCKLVNMEYEVHLPSVGTYPMDGIAVDLLCWRVVY